MVMVDEGQCRRDDAARPSARALSCGTGAASTLRVHADPRRTVRGPAPRRARYHSGVIAVVFAPMSKLRFSLRWLLPMGAALLLAACQSHADWQLDNVQGHLPDLKFQMTNDLGQPVTAATYRGKVVLLYFGYTHCPDVCPLTLVHLHTVLQKLGKQADDVRILFVTVDPARDTVPVLHQYVTAFDPRVVGLTGTQDAIAQLAKRYRAFYKPEPAKASSAGDYEVTHSSAIYIFDRAGRAQVLATPGSSNDEILHDLKILVEQPQ
jgi:protein SCO1/2